jgi:hypothetical protein
VEGDQVAGGGCLPHVAMSQEHAFFELYGSIFLIFQLRFVNLVDHPEGYDLT